MAQGKFNCLPNCLNLSIKSADVIKSNIGNFRSEKLLDVLANNTFIGKGSTRVNQDALSGPKSAVAQRTSKFNNAMASGLGSHYSAIHPNKFRNLRELTGSRILADPDNNHLVVNKNLLPR